MVTVSAEALLKELPKLAVARCRAYVGADPRTRRCCNKATALRDGVEVCGIHVETRDVVFGTWDADWMGGHSMHFHPRHYNVSAAEALAHDHAEGRLLEDGYTVFPALGRIPEMRFPDWASR